MGQFKHTLRIEAVEHIIISQRSSRLYYSDLG